ncbi:TIGR03943 family putative permease subunit [Paenibacillus soyae]|uniref:TIGR03943 family protein n=1 Tax=Paenibacillus soyae TaxID=2969249 RepID=A0A9X2MRJ0_9BACL|nr:TIGR03943 family protein [Paenibacillus soyae]MCR2804451.1 TIGR03943 family protein [Paenibacillus soyae]
MIRFVILVGFALLFAIIHQEGELNKYINTKYAYLSISAIVLLLILCIVEFVRVQLKDKAKKRKEEAEVKQVTANAGDHAKTCSHDDHDHDHAHDHEDEFGHSHEPKSRWKRSLGYLILFVPIITGIFLPVQTLDSSFVKAKGFSFPAELEGMSDGLPGEHQFLKPDSSVFYGKEGYEKLKNKELQEFAGSDAVTLDDSNYMKGMEVIYNFPGSFMGKTLTFTGFAYKGEQVDDTHYFVFRFGFIHCVADSGIFGMLVEFPQGTELADDDWVQVSGVLTSQLYQPFKQTIPVLRVTSWEPIPQPEDPYVYRNY